MKASNNEPIIVIGGGLAGSEAAWQISRRGCRVSLFEMKPRRFSPAHQSPLLAEIVCSNSLGSNIAITAPGLLKEELRKLDSLIIAAADATAVPAGSALAVDRDAFSRFVEEAITQNPDIEIIHEEATGIPDDAIVIVAAGPLCSDALTVDIAAKTGAEHLSFYDATSPIVEGGSLDFSKMFWASRDDPASNDYLNIPLAKEEYEKFCDELLGAEEVPLRHFEDAKFFEGCLPIEVLAHRGKKTLRFGPMKPIGIIDPRSGRRPYAVVQLRREGKTDDLFNMVGFQTKLMWHEQKRIFSLLPGMEKAVFARLGVIHRNTFINSPRLLAAGLALKSNGNIMFAGQITGVEGYVESTAMGLVAGLNAAALAQGKILPLLPPTTAIGALLRYVTSADDKNFQPMNINFGLFPPLEEKAHKKERRARHVVRARKDIDEFIKMMTVC